MHTENQNPHDVPQPLLPQRPRRFWAVVALAIVFLLAADFALSPPRPIPKETAVFTIKSGESLRSVSSSLAEGGYIRSPKVFSVLVTLLGGARRVFPGDYRFEPGESALGIASQIARDDHHLAAIKVTVPEGETAAEVASLLGEKIPGFDAKTFIADAKPYEGYLFPETYFFYSTTAPEEVVAAMRAMFDAKTAGLFASASLAGHTEKETVVMASLVEREASGGSDSAIIAGILWKRISLGMRLDVDAAPETYAHAGLPPGPIASPGLEAIQAALHPAATDYLYYLHDKNGSIHYAKTYAEHQKNIARYLR